MCVCMCVCMCARARTNKWYISFLADRRSSSIDETTIYSRGESKRQPFESVSCTCFVCLAIVSHQTVFALAIVSDCSKRDSKRAYQCIKFLVNLANL